METDEVWCYDVDEKGTTKNAHKPCLDAYNIKILEEEQLRKAQELKWIELGKAVEKAFNENIEMYEDLRFDDMTYGMHFESTEDLLLWYNGMY